MHISYSSCTKAKTNVLSKYTSMFSLKLKGKWSIRQGQGFHSNSDGIIHPLPLLRKISIGMTFHSYPLITKGELKGPQDSLFLAINAKGEKVLGPKQKDRTTTFSKFKNYFTKRKKLFQSVSKFQSVFHLVSKFQLA
jgi:hypothetical protein